MSHTVAQVDAAIAYLIGFAEDRAQTASYSRVFKAAGLEPPQALHMAGDHAQVTAFMKAIHDRCLEQHLPPLDSLVVHVDGDRKDFPGAGYFKVNDLPDARGEHVSPDDQMRGYSAWQAQVSECRVWGRDHRQRR